MLQHQLLLLLLLTVCYTLLCEMSSKVPQQQLWNDVKLHWSSCYLVFPAFWEFATRFVPRDLPSLESSSVSNENIHINSTSILRYVSLCNFLKSVLEKFFKTIELCQSSPFFLHFLESKKKSSKKCFNSHLIYVLVIAFCWYVNVISWNITTQLRVDSFLDFFNPPPPL